MTELETMQRAKLYLDKLAQGIDPISGEEVPADSVLNNVRLARCFFYVSGVLQRVIDNGGEVGSKPRVKKIPFSITHQQLASIRIGSEPLRIGEFMELLHQAAGGNPEMTRPATTVVTNWLLEKGFLYKQDGPDGKPSRIPTEAGRRLGIYTEERQGQYGTFLAVFYMPQAQQFLLDNLPGILQL